MAIPAGLKTAAGVAGKVGLAGAALGGLAAGVGAISPSGRTHLEIDGEDLDAIREIREAAAARLGELSGEELAAAQAELRILDEAIEDAEREKGRAELRASAEWRDRDEPA